MLHSNPRIGAYLYARAGNNGQKARVDAPQRRVTMRKYLICVLLALSVTGCLGGASQIAIKDHQFNPGDHTWTAVVENISRTRVNYVEVSIQCLDANGTVIASGWTNLINLSPGERRQITIYIPNYPAQGFPDSRFYWSTRLGEVPK